MNYKKLVIKAVVTFVETVVGSLVVSHGDLTNKVVLAGAVGLGLSVVWNTVVYPQLQDWLKK